MMRLVLFFTMVLFSACVSETEKPKGPVGLKNGESIGHKTSMATQAVELIGGEAHVCAHLIDGRAKCWGLNDHNQCDLKAARNVKKVIHDIRNAQFSKLTAGSSYTCGIVKDEPYKGIPFCFGEEGPWLDVPHEPIIDIAANNSFVCFIRENGTLGCVGHEVDLLLTIAGDGVIKRIKAEDFVRHGIDPVSKKMESDFSNKKFKSVKVGDTKVCAQGADDGIVYCMGSNIRGAGESYPEEVLDYGAGNPNRTPLIRKDGTLTMVGAGLSGPPAKNIPDRYLLKYKKMLATAGIILLTAKGNTYGNGAVMPEDTLVTFDDLTEEGVLGAVEVESDLSSKPHRVYCILKYNQKIKCVSPRGLATSLMNEIPKELSYQQ